MGDGAGFFYFENKQAILGGIVDAVLDGYGRRSIFALANWEDPAFTVSMPRLKSNGIFIVGKRILLPPYEKIKVTGPV